MSVLLVMIWLKHKQIYKDIIDLNHWLGEMFE